MKERIRLIQEQLGLSQIEFANKLGISPASLSSIYTGRTNPTNNHVMAIHKAFPQINVNWLMFGEGDMTEGGVVGAVLNENGEAVNNNDEGGLENGKSDTSVSPAGLALFSSEGKEVPGGDVVSRMGLADGVNSSHLGVFNEDSYSRRSKNTNIIDKPVREIKEIRVFFSDGTYEAFVPSGK